MRTPVPQTLPPVIAFKIASDEFQICENVLRGVGLEGIYFLRLHFCKFWLWSSTGLSECLWMHNLQTHFTCTSFKGLPKKLAKCHFLFYAYQN